MWSGKKKKEKQILEDKPRLIGIGSTGHGVGCTHVSIMLLNYLSGCERRKAVLLEWNRSGDFEKLEKICTGKIREKKRFQVLDADYYKAAGPAELGEVLECNFNDILIDFGVLREDCISEFMRCEEQLVVGSLSEWQEEAFRKFVKEHGTGKKSWKYIAAFGSEETRKEFMRRPGVAVERIPSSVDAFSVTKECSRFFTNLI